MSDSTFNPHEESGESPVPLQFPQGSSKPASTNVDTLSTDVSHLPGMPAPYKATPFPIPDAPELSPAARMRAIAKDPTRPTNWHRMTPAQVAEQTRLATRRICDVFIMLGQASPAECVEMSHVEMLANCASLLEAQVGAKTDYDAFYAIKQEQDELVVFLRNAYAREIAAGRHAGRSLASVIIGYLEMERRSWWSRVKRLFL